MQPFPILNSVSHSEHACAVAGRARRARQQGDAPRANSLSLRLGRVSLTLGFQPGAAPRAQPFHEAAANECGSARRLTLARLVVDLDRQQNRPAVVKTPIEQFFEMRLVADPNAVGDAGARAIATMSLAPAVAARCLPVI